MCAYVIKSSFEIQWTKKVCTKERKKSLNLMAIVLSTYRQNEDKRKEQQKKKIDQHTNYRSQSSHVFYFSYSQLNDLFIFPFNFHCIYTKHLMQNTNECTLYVVYLKPCEGNHDS